MHMTYQPGARRGLLYPKPALHSDHSCPRMWLAWAQAVEMDSRVSPLCLPVLHVPSPALQPPLLQDVARMNPGEAVKMDSEYRSFLAELGGGPAPEAGASGAPRGGGGGAWGQGGMSGGGWGPGCCSVRVVGC